MAIEPSSPTGSSRTLNDELAAARRQDRRLPVLPHSRPYSHLLLWVHRWGAACLPKGKGGAPLQAVRRARIPPPTAAVCSAPPARQHPAVDARARPAQVPVPPRHHAAVVSDSVAERRPLREREDAAVHQPTPAESQDRSVADIEVSAGGDRSTESSAEHAATVVGRGGSIWVRVSPKRVINPPLQVESPQTPLADSPAADDKFVWANKYRPNSLKDFICNKDVALELHQLVTAHECNHFIFEGPQAVGKRSMVLALIRDAFHPEDDLKIDELTKRFELKGEIAKYIDIRARSSNHHVEVNLADLHGYEKYVITTLLDESIPSPNLACDHTNCRVIVVHDADKLSSDLQLYIGWFLGRYAGCNKIIFCCSDASNLEVVRHLCKVFTLHPPSPDEITKVLQYIAKQENIDLPHNVARRITMSANNNPRQAIRSFEATWKANYPFREEQDILTGWEEEISNVAKKIIEEPSPRQLFLIRGKIRKLIEHNVSPYFIFCHLVAELKRDMDEDFQNNVDKLASEFNRCEDCMFKKQQCELCKSRDTFSDIRDIKIEGFSKDVHDQRETIQCFIKIEEFTVRFMSFYKSLIAKNLKKGNVP